MGPEAKFTQWLKRHLKAKADIQRIEVITAQGVPDCNIAIKGRPGNIWVELKSLKAVKMRKEQYAWGMRRTTAYDDTVYLWNGYEQIIQMWRFPFEAVPAGKDHLKPITEPYYEFSYDYFKEDFDLTHL
jgi:hypothetical protein